MEEGIKKFLLEYLRKTDRLRTLEVLRDELIPKKSTKLSFSIQSAPRRPGIDKPVAKKSCSKSKKCTTVDKKCMMCS